MDAHSEQSVTICCIISSGSKGETEVTTELVGRRHVGD